MSATILVIDQGTTSTRAMLFDATGAECATAQTEFPQIFPKPGWVEHDPADLWATTASTMAEAIARGGGGSPVAIGLTNQRETTIVWDRRTGTPVYNAIVWQDRRTAEACARLKADGHEAFVAERTGLLLDPYFSATKIAWILDSVEGARARAEAGDLVFGTVDTFLLWRLTDGAVFATDATNASRTLLYNITTGDWDDALFDLFRIPRSMRPEVRDTAGVFGTIAAGHPAAGVPILAVAGDQQAALIGQSCLTPGMIKATYGTGAFVLLNTGATIVRSSHRLLTTVAYQWRGIRHYALEGAIFSAGATVQWLRDGLGIIGSAAECGALAAEADPAQAVFLVPAFTGLGAPVWDSNARATISGLTRGTTRREIARAALESVGYQTHDLIASMLQDASTGLGATDETIIRVDGGMTASDWTMQFLADILDAPVDRPRVRETTAFGVALAAGWQADVYPGPDDMGGFWQLDRGFRPGMAEDTRARHLRGWKAAVARTLLKDA